MISPGLLHVRLVSENILGFDQDRLPLCVKTLGILYPPLISIGEIGVMVCTCYCSSEFRQSDTDILADHKNVLAAMELRLFSIFFGH